MMGRNAIYVALYLKRINFSSSEQNSHFVNFRNEAYVYFYHRKYFEMIAKISLCTLKAKALILLAAASVRIKVSPLSRVFRL